MGSVCVEGGKKCWFGWISLCDSADLCRADDKPNKSMLSAALLNVLHSFSGTFCGISSEKVLLAWDLYFYFQKQVCCVSMLLTLFFFALSKILEAIVLI